MRADLLCEPRLEDLYRDDAFHLLLARDGLTLDHVQAAVAQARREIVGATPEAFPQVAE